MLPKSAATPAGRPQRAIYCMEHFPDAARAWYEAALDRTNDLLGGAERLRADDIAKSRAKLLARLERKRRSAAPSPSSPPSSAAASSSRVQKTRTTPTRIQPRRGAKDAHALRALEKAALERFLESDGSASDEHEDVAGDEDALPEPVIGKATARKIRKLLAAAPLPLDEDDRPVDGVRWTALLHRAVDVETRRLIERFVAGNVRCPYGRTPWVCGECYAEAVEGWEEANRLAAGLAEAAALAQLAEMASPTCNLRLTYSRAVTPPLDYDDPTPDTKNHENTGADEQPNVLEKSDDELSSPSPPSDGEFEIDVNLDVKVGSAEAVPAASMEIAGSPKLLNTKGWMDVKVPKDRIVSVAGFRLVVDICDGIVKYMILDN